MENIGTLIAGAGLAGLSTAYHLQGDYILVERDDAPGGLVRSEEIKGCVFDITGHWLHLRTKRVKDMVAGLLGNTLVSIRRRALIFAHGRYVNYPFQSNLADLPDDVASDCAVEAVRSAIALAKGRISPIKTFRDFAITHFGAGITREFIEPYNAKLWGVGIDQVTSEWCDRFVPVPDVYKIVEGAVRRRGQSEGYNASFLYPEMGGIEALPKAIYNQLPVEKVFLSTPLKAVNASKHEALIRGQWVKYDTLVSTLPLPVLAGMVVDMDGDLRQAAGKLRASELVYAVGAVRGEPLINGAHWLYLPGNNTGIYRFGVPSNVLSTLAPAGMSSFYAEFTPTFSGDKQEAVAEVRRLLEMLGRKGRDLEFLELRHYPFGYVIFDRYRKDSVTRLFNFLESHDIYSIGRFGAWTYNAMEDAIIDGMKVAERIGGRHGD